MLNKAELTKAVSRYARRHNTSAEFIRTNTTTMRDAIAEWNAANPKQKRTLAQQYADGKAAAPGVTLIFIVGDFAELFFDDAKLVAKVLGLTLTTRGPIGKNGGDMPMTGFPKYQVATYLPKLASFGLRVAVVEAE